MCSALLVATECGVLCAVCVVHARVAATHTIPPRSSDQVTFFLNPPEIMQLATWQANAEVRDCLILGVGGARCSCRATPIDPPLGLLVAPV